MDFQIDLTQIILAVITLIGGIVVRYLIPFIKEKTNEKTFHAIQAVCETAVYFAQQWYKQEDGDVKKQHAMEHAQAELEARGISIDIQLIDDCIEAEVQKLKIALKEQ